LGKKNLSEVEKNVDANVNNYKYVSGKKYINGDNYQNNYLNNFENTNEEWGWFIYFE
jgi:hypothetical protein